MACFFRPTSPSTRFSLWGEDGPIFTQQARAHGVFHSFFTTYAGYFHLIPRTVAAISSALPLQWTPPIYALASYTVVAAVTVAAWLSARGMGMAVPSSAAVAATVFVLPSGDFEVFGTLTNVQWYLAAGAIVFTAGWIGGYSPRVVPAALALLVVGLTSPLVITLIPAVLIVAIVRRRALDWAVLAAIAISGAVQAAGAAHSPSSAPGHYSLVGALDVYLVRFVDGSFVGWRLLETVLLAFSRDGAATAGGVLFAALLIASILWLVRDSSRRPNSSRGLRGFRAKLAGGGSVDLRRWVPLFLVVQSVILYVEVAVLRSGVVGALLGDLGGGNPTWAGMGARYAAGPGVALAMAALVLLDGVSLRRPAPRAHAPQFRRSQVRYQGGVWLLGLWAVVLVANFPLDFHREPLRTWEASVNKAQAACRADPHSAVVVGNAPGGPDWVLHLTCRQAFG